MKKILLLLGLIILSQIVVAEVDPNFYIFLCFGQSNMEGQGDIEDEDMEGISDRFKMMASIDMPQNGRTQGQWYKAEPPLCRDWNRIGPTDYFGRTLVKKLPKEIKVGVINVAVGGCKIELFDDEQAETYLDTTEDWLKNIAVQYGNHPYKVLMARAKEAQKVGVIKGILLHQGESNNGDKYWPKKVKYIYEKMLKELKLKSEDVPLLVGEVVTKEEGGMCDDHNKIIATVPDVIPNSYVISAKGCSSKGDGYHFNTEGYRLLGKRYGEKMLELLGVSSSSSDFDPNFYIFLCFGQSNMEGQGDIEDEDMEGISDRFKMMAAIDMPQNKRKQGQWYKAEPPLCRDWNRIGPTDYFGRTLVKKLPKEIKVGVINVAVGGCKIELFDEDKAESYLETTEDWLKNIAVQYDNNPYRVLINRAKEAKKVGVIKGILLHQGESNNGEKDWPKKVKLVYERMLSELKLKSEDVPLLVGEVVTKEEGGMCDAHNKIIATVPDVIPNSYVISAKGCSSKGDGYHFNTEGYRLLGKRYGEKMLELLSNNEED